MSMAWGGIAGSLIDGVVQGFTKKREAQMARRNYRHRYRWTVKDMKLAGLNPIMAAGMNPPVPDTVDTSVNTDFAGSIASAIGLKQQKDLIKSQAGKNDAEAASASEDARRKKAVNDLELKPGDGKGLAISIGNDPQTSAVRREMARDESEDNTASLYEQKLRAGIEATRSSAVSNTADARYKDAMTTLTPQKRAEIENAIKNHNMDDLHKAWMELGGRAISSFGTFLSVVAGSLLR